MMPRYAVGALDLPSVSDRLAALERQRRQDFLTPAAVTTLILLATGLLPALHPVFEPFMLAWLGAAIGACGGAIWANRRDNVGLAIVLYMLGTAVFYLGAVFAVPAGPNGELSYQNFAGGNLYYFVLGVLPIFASALLLDPPWPYIVNGLQLIVPQVCIWLLPHPPEFGAFASYIGGPIFLAGSVASGQIMLFAFALAIVRTLRRSLEAANRVSDLETLNARIAERQAMLNADIRILQQAHSDISNGVPARIALQPGSELYPVAVSLNLLSDRLAKLGRVNIELQQVHAGLAEATRVVARIGQGDLSASPAPTGTSVDGLLAALVQVQGQIAAWVRGISGALGDVRQSRQQTHEAATDLIIALRQMDELVRLSGVAAHRPEVEEILGLARDNAEQLLRRLEGVERRDALVAEALARVSLGPPARALPPQH